MQCELSLLSFVTVLSTVFCDGLAEDAVLDVEPYWSTFFIGESVTFKCDMNEGEKSDWQYKIQKDGQAFVHYNTHEKYTLSLRHRGDKGQYQCFGRNKYDSQLIKKSNTVNLSVSAAFPKATLTLTTTTSGGSVILSCSVKNSEGWTYEYFRRTQSTTEAPVRTDGEENRVSVKQGGIYRCRGSRGPITSYISDDVPIDITLSNKVVIKQEPKWPQSFSGEVVTLKCEVQGGDVTDWQYDWRFRGKKSYSSYGNNWILTATRSSSGEYTCKGIKRGDPYSSTEWSDAITLAVLPGKPKAQIQADIKTIPVGGNVTLICSVSPSSGWKYSWYRFLESSHLLTAQDAVFHVNGKISVSQVGLYWCKGGRGNPVYYSEDSDAVTIDQNVPYRAVVKLQHKWPQIYNGEKITLRCDIHEEIEWEYEFKSPMSSPFITKNELVIFYASSSVNGDYKCRGRKKNAPQFLTGWSDSFSLEVLQKPSPVLSVSPSWLSPGVSVTLKCEVENPSAGWRIYWYKAIPDLSKITGCYSYELLPDSSNGTAQDLYIIHQQTHTAAFACRAARGDPLFYTLNSEPKFVWSGDFNAEASLQVIPSRVQHFSADSVSLSCEGNCTEWRVKKINNEGAVSDCVDWVVTKGSTCQLHSGLHSNAVYWCECASAFSNAVNITKQSEAIILESPVHPVAEGDPVTLSCKLREEQTVLDVIFYKDDKVIQSDTIQELTILAVSKSDEGFYKCQHAGKESPQSWMAVKSVPKPENDLFLPMLIAGLVCGFLLIILFLLFCYYKKSKGSSSARSQSVNQSSVTDCMINQDEKNTYTSPVHDDTCVYESIKVSDDNETCTTGGRDESGDVTYASIELKRVAKNEQNKKTEESCIYSDVMIRSSTEKPAPSATDETVYSEVKTSKNRAQ
ncbi:Fc receptor-like protein 5 isoform 2-T2 [Pholidichthys leucotaenia]